MDNKFYVNGYSATLQTIKDKIRQLQAEYSNLTVAYSSGYKTAIVRKYMTLWAKSGEFPKDNELTRIIFYLGDLDLTDMGFEGLQDNAVPKNRLNFNEVTQTFKFEYFNERLGKWIELKP